MDDTDLELPSKETPSKESAPEQNKTLSSVLQSKVPEVTIYFWIIKCLSTALGETLADVFSNDVFHTIYGSLGFFFGLLFISLVVQFWLKKYFAPIYWFSVLLISIAGTLVTDVLSDNVGVAHWWTTLIFSVLLAATFLSWFYFERTLSIHSIYTIRREAFYWFAVLFSFALGTATGDMVSEDFSIGYWGTLLIVIGLIGIDAVAYAICRIYLKPPRQWVPILTFWICYVLTRPLGASLGDLLTADSKPTFDDSYCVPYNTSNFNETFYDPATNTLDCGDMESCMVNVDCPSGSSCNGTLTCYSPLPCDLCYGAEQIIATNVVFSAIVVGLVIFLAVSKKDVLKKSTDEVDPRPVDVKIPS